MRRAACNDRDVQAKFVPLARELGDLGVWVRLHYVYPYPHVDDVIPLMAEGQKTVACCPISTSRSSMRARRC